MLLIPATAGIAVPLFGRPWVSPMLGFLIAGVALGPFRYFAAAKPAELSMAACRLVLIATGAVALTLTQAPTPGEPFGPRFR